MQKHETVTILHGDCRNVLATIPSGSVDAVVTDPPYGLEFMGKDWDAPWRAEGLPLPAQGFQRWFETVAVELLRVLKPGGHLLAFGGTRTYHRLACAIEDAGFEVRDSIHWLYGSGFPKSLDVSKAIDKQAGAKREVVGIREDKGRVSTFGGGSTSTTFETAPATDAAKQWEGWGTALKPAHEPIVVARKPLDGTVAANVLEFGTGALNIDATRVPNNGAPIPRITGKGILCGTTNGWNQAWKNNPDAVAARQERADAAIEKANTVGRWPANIVHDGSPEVLERFPNAKGGQYPAARGKAVATAFASGQETEGGQRAMGDDGSAARFFTSAGWHDDDAASFYYCAKANARERNAGLNTLPDVEVHRYGAGIGEGLDPDAPARPIANIHPTVKPLALMRWLVRLACPPGGVVLDPFAGSGTTLCAAILEGKQTIGIEMTDEYLPIIRGRVAWAQAQTNGKLFHAG